MNVRRVQHTANTRAANTVDIASGDQGMWSTTAQSRIHRPWSAELVVALRGPFFEYWPASTQALELRDSLKTHAQEGTASLAIGAHDSNTCISWPMQSMVRSLNTIQIELRRPFQIVFTSLDPSIRCLTMVWPTPHMTLYREKSANYSNPRLCRPESPQSDDFAASPLRV